MSNAFVIIKICYVHNQWYDISCATLYIYVCVCGGGGLRSIYFFIFTFFNIFFILNKGRVPVNTGWRIRSGMLTSLRQNGADMCKMGVKQTVG